MCFTSDRIINRNKKHIENLYVHSDKVRFGTGVWRGGEPKLVGNQSHIAGPIWLNFFDRGLHSESEGEQARCRCLFDKGTTPVSDLVLLIFDTFNSIERFSPARRRTNSRKGGMAFPLLPPGWVGRSVGRSNPSHFPAM